MKLPPQKQKVLSLIKWLYVFFFFFFSITIFAQITIEGKIVADDNSPIVRGNVILKKDGLTIVFSQSNNEGFYKLSTAKTGKFTLLFTALNYESKLIEIEISPDDTSIEKNIILSSKPMELKEIIIKQERPITIKKDTIIFLAKSFLLGNEQVVEDLLKKIPGLTVTADGTVKVGNQEVEKIMIDGDDLFERGYKLITKNMPVRPIEKVELYQHYSNNKHLKGIEKSDKVALNLTLKDEFKRQWFGNLEIGYGVNSENRYWLRGNLMNFGKKSKYYFLSNLNNLGEDATGDINAIIRPYRMNDVGNIGDDQNAQTILSSGSYTPNLKSKRVNLNNAEMMAINSLFNVTSKTKLKILGFFNSDEINYIRNSFQSFTTNNTNFQNNENFVNQKAIITGFGKLDVTHNISKTKTIEFTSKFNSTAERNNSSLNFNGDLLNEKLRSQNQLIDQKLVFTSKFAPTKVILFSARYINEETPQRYAVNKFLYQNLFTQNANNLTQTSENKMDFIGIQGHYLNRKKNGNLFEIQFGNQFRLDKLKTVFTLKENENFVNEPIDYQNDLLYQTNDLFLKTKYDFYFGKFNLSPSLDLHQLFNYKSNFQTKLEQTPFIVNPKIGLGWEINKKNRISTFLTSNTANATVTDVYDNFIHTGFRSFDKGTGTFNQLNKHTAMLNYSLGNWGDKFFSTTSLLWSQNRDFFSTNSTITQNVIQTEKILIKNQQYVSLNTDINKYFKVISSNLKLNFTATESNFKNIVNNSDLREIKQQSLIYGTELRSSFRGFFNYHFGSSWTTSKVQTSITNSFTDNMTFLDLSFVFSKQFNIQIQSERYYFGNLDKESNKYYFLDFEARFQPKKGKINFAITGNNLFNIDVFRNYSINDVSISQTEFRLQPRYVLLKMEFRF